MSDYQAFLRAKERVTKALGFEASDINSRLYPFQQDIVRWACRMGRAAIFADCGTGKTPMQLEFANQVRRHVGPSAAVLILAPLSVAQQTVREGQKFGIEARYLREDDDRPGIVVANYEMLEHFEVDRFAAVILDESSILKAQNGKTRNALIQACAQVPYRLACTATPAPNDFMELGNHCEFLGVMSRTEMLSMYFVHDGGSTQRESAREDADERHVCPLQLGVIERALHLWSRPNDLILSPFAGIGSEGYQALKMGRRFVGCELKGSYFKQAALNLERAEKAESVGDLFSGLGA